jgi:hypothetical protein
VTEIRAHRRTQPGDARPGDAPSGEAGRGD